MAGRVLAFPPRPIVRSGLSDLACCCDWGASQPSGIDWANDQSFYNNGQNLSMTNGNLAGLGTCPQGPMVVIEETPIPDWVWWVAGGVALLLIFKKTI